MIEVRFHGRGGQGAVTSAELIALAAISLGKYAQAFPSFGPERRGAPVLAFLRVSDEPINTREKVYEPNLVVVLDEALAGIVNVEAGLSPDGIVIINSVKSFEELRRDFGFKARLAKVDALNIAREILKVPIVNTPMLGALVKVSGIVSVESLEVPIMNRFGTKLGERNFNAIKRAYEETILEESSWQEKQESAVGRS